MPPAAEPRGEIVIVVAPPDPQAAAAAPVDLDALLRGALARLSVKQAVGEIAAITGRAARDLSARVGAGR
jgi:16S rRNA (cytidine1402-2'-O)-methyltransferase